MLEVNTVDYQMEDLLPIVFDLAQNYSGYENTSITYEKAQMLMGAVIYCLEEFNNTPMNSLVYKGMSIKERYDVGKQLVYKKAVNIQKIFNELSCCFEDYGVKCLYDTVQKGIPQFLKWYDVKYNPQNTILTLDYPLLIDCYSLNGADAIYKYILGIQAEQRFLGIFDKGYIVSILKKYDPRYEYMIDNICEIVLINMIGHVVLRKAFDEVGFQNADYSQLTKLFANQPVSDIEEFIKCSIKEMLNKLFTNNADVIFEYLCHGAGNIAARIETASRFDQLNKLFVL